MSGSCIEDGAEYEENELFISWVKKSKRLPRLHPKACSDKCGCFPKTKPDVVNVNNNDFINNIDLENIINFINDGKFIAPTY
tara:strand:+ start:1355 stop:1600 length:246 start_codon:yes stop_codon:yes gene_type:complete